MTRTISTSAHARATLVLGLPLIGSSLAQMALHVVDTVMLGWYGVVALAAGVLGSSTFFILFVLGSGFAKAVLPMVAQSRATGDEVQVRRSARMGLWLSGAFGVAIYPVFWWSEPILLALGQQPDVAAIGQDYLRIVGLGMVPALWVAVLQSWLAALGRTQMVLWVTVAAVGLNIAVNWALIFGNWGFPEMGAAGAAVATLLVQLVSFGVLAPYAALLPGLRPYRLFQRFWRVDRQALRQVFVLGWPIGLTGIAEGGLFHASALMMGWVGTVELAAHGIAMQVTAIGFMVHVGLSNAATVRTGRFAGQGDWANLRRGGVMAIAVSGGVGLIQIALYLTFAQQIVGLFIDRSSPDAAQILMFGSLFLAYAAAFQMMDAGQVLALGLLRGVQDTRVPMIIAAVAYWLIGIPAAWALAFPAGWAGAGLWMGLVIGLACAASALMWRFWTRVPRG